MASRNKGMLSQFAPSQVTRVSLARLASQGCSASSAPLDLAALSEGTLTPRRLRQLVRHVRGCPTCAAALASLINDAPRSAGRGDPDRHWHAANGSRPEPCVDCADE